MISTLLAALLIAAGLPASSLAGQTDSVTVTLPDDLLGNLDAPGIRLLADLSVPYAEEEFLVAGTADVYNYTSHPGVPGSLTVKTAAVPYKTRILVRRPLDSADFNGTVVVEWWNSTAGFDTAPAWDASAEYFTREGIVYVGVTNAVSSIDWAAAGCALLSFGANQCGTRYASLAMTDNGQAYDMVSQIANLLKTGAAGTPLPAGFNVTRLFHAGQSQQGGSMVAYATNFHFSANDGYFIQAASRARRINDDVSCDDVGAPAYPACRAELQGADQLVRTDLTVPVTRAMTETDVPRVLTSGSRQTDSGLFRYYELAGAAHVQVHKGVEFDIFGFVYTLETLCADELNTLADGPIFGSVLYNAMWHNMQEEVDNATSAPASRIFDTTGTTIDRDIHGNTLGGVRVPQMDYPVATYGGSNSLAPGLPEVLAPLGNLFCVLAGTVHPFTEGKIDSLYGDWESLYDSLFAAADVLIADRFLLPHDKGKLVTPETWTIPALGAFGPAFLGVGLVAAAWATRRRMQSRRSG